MDSSLWRRKIDEQHNTSGFIRCVDNCITAMVLGGEYGAGRHMAVRGYSWIGRILGKKEKQIIKLFCNHSAVLWMKTEYNRNEVSRRC